MERKCIYLIGSLRNREIVHIGNLLRGRGYEAFDDWMAPGPEADDHWRDYAKERGMNYREALKGWAATHVFEFDRAHLDRANAGLLIYPAGKSAHAEMGYLVGQGKPVFVLMENEPDPDRWDVMIQFASEIFFSREEMLAEIVRRV